eukprot:CAMPEP_0178956284 /NCGR_PEP_ID=MMETSP0789-20121207/10142_1 /TAXON_ID=3005 /ORGANISM="Rhizosolenia setigera, Strain CCMP 1694" /LENGTH=323 /DNA_ID=CAMNT_0020638143 /DNA_START=31 /DNA_END=999 /DNA_ORIENTATION=+
MKSNESSDSTALAEDSVRLAKALAQESTECSKDGTSSRNSTDCGNSRMSFNDSLDLTVLASAFEKSSSGKRLEMMKRLDSPLQSGDSFLSPANDDDDEYFSCSVQTTLTSNKSENKRISSKNESLILGDLLSESNDVSIKNNKFDDTMGNEDLSLSQNWEHNFQDLSQVLESMNDVSCSVTTTLTSNKSKNKRFNSINESLTLGDLLSESNDASVNKNKFDDTMGNEDLSQNWEHNFQDLSQVLESMNDVSCSVTTTLTSNKSKNKRFNSINESLTLGDLLSESNDASVNKNKFDDTMGNEDLSQNWEHNFQDLSQVLESMND